MKAYGRIRLVATALLIICLTASVVLLRQVDKVRKTTSGDDVLYLSSPKLLRYLSLGYTGLLADVYWTRAVQYFGDNHARGTGHYSLLAPLLQITTGLDPHLTVAYDFGANFLGSAPQLGAGDPASAVKLVEYGIHHNPEDWRLYQNLGFIYYLDLKDYPHAADAFAQGSRIPNAHPFMKTMAAQMAQHAGEIETARMLWTSTLENTKDRDIRANALAHLRALKVDSDVTNLENLIGRYRDKTGHLPNSYAELRSRRLAPRSSSGPAGESISFDARWKNRSTRSG